MKYNVVFHVDLNDEAILNVAISNVSNYFIAMEHCTADDAAAGFTAFCFEIKNHKADVIMLVNGPAVNLFKKEVAPQEIKELIKKGLKVRLCQNALNKFSLTKEMMLEDAEVVPAGIVELVRLQNEHYAYIKP